MTLESFRPFVGAEYRVSQEDDGPLVASLLLASVERSSWAGESDRPFSLLFECPAETPLDQALYWLATEGAEPQPIFLVPVAPGRYEAVFN